MKTEKMAKGNGRMLFFEFKHNNSDPPDKLNRVSLEDTYGYSYFFRVF